MRAVVDTNVLIAGLLWRGTPHTLLQCARSGELSLTSSTALLNELSEMLGRPKFESILACADTSMAELLSQVRQGIDVVEPVPLPLPLPVCRDPDDDEVLALALAVRAELIVSGDNDLLVLQQFQGIPIVTPTQALALLVAAR